MLFYTKTMPFVLGHPVDDQICVLSLQIDEKRTLRTNKTPPLTYHVLQPLQPPIDNGASMSLMHFHHFSAAHAGPSSNMYGKSYTISALRVVANTQGALARYRGFRPAHQITKRSICRLLHQ